MPRFLSKRHCAQYNSVKCNGPAIGAGCRAISSGNVMKRFVSAALGAALVSAAASAAIAQPAPAAGQPAPQVVRGTITGVTPNALKLTSREGKPLTIALSPDWSVQVTKPVTVAAIQPGSFIGTSEMPQANGSGRSLEVHVFPPGVKMGEGHYGWDLKKGSMMTNGTVGKVAAGAHGQELDVSYSTGTRHIVVPPNVPIVQITPGERSMVKPGTKVFLIAVKTPNGALATNGVAIGEAGKAPPM